MKDQILTVQFNNKISGGVYHMSLAGDCSEISRPGQFIDIKIDDFFLRRPISIFDHDDDHVEILYRVIGAGTDALATKAPGDELDVLLPLGNGFDAEKCGERSLLVAGGIGMPPIHELAKQLNDSAHSFRVLLGFRSADDIFGIDSFRSLCIEPVIATEDGSAGVKGLVTDVMEIMRSGKGHAKNASAASGNDTTGELDFDYDCVFCCGPEPMLRAVYETAIKNNVSEGQFSFEERMGCGFGACMGCSCKTRYGYKRICRDGPILSMDEILW